MSAPRLIERWLPIAELGAESVREGSAAQKPPVNRLHVWWARRPLVASRAAILASLLPADADRKQFMRVLGIAGDPVKARRLTDNARRTGVRVDDPYGYARAFTYSPGQSDRGWVLTEAQRAGVSHPVVLDPTAGGGSIPFEAARLGLHAIGNDLNPVAVLVERATVQWPHVHGPVVYHEFVSLARQWRVRVAERIGWLFPTPVNGVENDTTYIWARTVVCPYCEGLIPLSPNWRITPNGTGMRLVPVLGDGPGSHGRVCRFEVVASVLQQSLGTVADGDATCPFPDCGRVVDGTEIKRQAQQGSMGEQLFAVASRKRTVTPGKVGKNGRPGKPRETWSRVYRAPRPEDDNSKAIAAEVANKLPEWEALDLVPNEAIPPGSKTTEPLRYGMSYWRDMFSPRQLFGHVTSVEVFRELLGEAEGERTLSDAQRAAFGYLAIALDKMLNYNSRMSIWMPTREIMANTFNRHDFAFAWSYAEMNPLAPSLGLDWAIDATGKCIGELVTLARPGESVKAGGKIAAAPSLFESATAVSPPITITCGSADSLEYIADESVDLIVIDPPYYNNVMYAELSDFFYVWLKRTAGYVFHDIFTRRLTDKTAEAVANPGKFIGEAGATRLAGRDYRDRMAAIFAECRRALKPDGVMTLMFTHKATNAWDALTTGLVESGFSISASWPVDTESDASLHIRDKSAANSTIFLVCRPRAGSHETAAVHYWEDVEPKVARAVRTRVKEFQQAGITGVDLYLASFGPALEEFSRHWPLKRGTPAQRPLAHRRRKQQELFEEEWDPYAVTPEDALDAARREVKRWRLEQLTHLKTRAELDPLTSFFVLAWDAFRAPVFPYDEALRLARAVGVDLDTDVIGRIADKKGSDVRLWDSATRAAKGSLGPADGTRSMLDAVHHAAYFARTRTLDAARDLIADAGLSNDPQFFAALEAVLEILPVGKAFSGIELDGDLAASGSDFEALEKLRRLAFAEQVDEPKQLEMWIAEAAQ